MPLTKRSTIHAVGRGALTPPHKTMVLPLNGGGLREAALRET